MNDEEKEEALPWGCRSSLYTTVEQELVYYFGASLVITATAPGQGEKLDPALPALYRLDCAASIVIDDSPHGSAAVAAWRGVERRHCGQAVSRKFEATSNPGDVEP